jgi:cytochrome c556
VIGITRLTLLANQPLKGLFIMKKSTTTALKIRLAVASATLVFSAVSLRAETSLLANSAVASTFEKPEQAVQYRKSVFTVQSRAFGALRAMSKGDLPFNAADAKANAHIISTLSSLPWSAFGAGTDSNKTKPEIWTDAAGFKSAADKYMIATVVLESVAKTGDLAQIRTAVGALGATCKQCHEAYKK